MFVSIISKIEFLSYPNLSEADLLIFNKFLNRVELVELNDNKENNIIETIILLRKKYRIKLPDSIIAASAITNNATLVTADKDFQKIAELKIELKTDTIYWQNQGCKPLYGLEALGFNRKKGLIFTAPAIICLVAGNKIKQHDNITNDRRCYNSNR